MSTPKKYRPSNGDEGVRFMSKWCSHCKHDDPLATPEKFCPIIGITMGYDKSDPEYPEEWTYTEDGTPTCTAFERELTPEEERQQRIQVENEQREAQGQLRLFEVMA